MKFSIPCAAFCITLLAGLTNAVVIPQLLPRAPRSLPSYLRSSRRLYRAIYKEEMQAIGTRYVEGYAPADHKTNAGDFAPDRIGGLYLFNNRDEAMTWGDCYTRGTAYESRGYVLATFEYTYDSTLKIGTFSDGDENWSGFVNANYAPGTGASGFDMIEGPISALGQNRRHVLYEREGEAVWQAAFITTKALRTLRVAELLQIPVGRQRPSNLRRCCSQCTIM